MVEKMEGNREEAAAICAKRQWINCPVEDITDHAEGASSTMAPAESSRTLPADALLEG